MIVCTADWHLDGSGDRYEATDRLIDAAARIKPTLILVAGDTFHKRTQPASLQTEGIRRLVSLSEIAPTVVVAGNHDSSLRTSSLKAFGLLRPSNLHLCSGIRLIRFPHYNVVAVPWIFRTRDRGAMSTSILNVIATLKEQSIGKTYLVAHCTMLGVKYGGYRDVVLGREIIWPTEFLSGFEFCCLGHIHQSQFVTERAVYPGSIERIDFGERNEDKGFFTWDGKKAEFHSLSPRPMYWLKGGTEIIKEAKALPDGSKVRLTFQLNRGDSVGQIKLPHLKSLEVQVEYKSQERRISGILGKNVYDALELYLGDRENKDELMELAKSLQIHPGGDICK